MWISLLYGNMQHTSVLLLPEHTCVKLVFGFSWYSTTETKYRNRTDAAHDVKTSLTTIQASIPQIYKQENQ